MKQINQFVFSILFLSVATYSFAQDKMLTVEDAILKGGTTLAPENMTNLTWRNAEKFTYTKNYGGEDYIMECNVKNNLRDTLMSLQDINDAMYFAQPKLDSVKRMPMITWLTENDYYFINNNKLVVMHVKDNSTPEVKLGWEKGIENMDFCYTTWNMAYTKDNNLYIQMPEDKVVQITKDDNKGIVNGQAVHRNEWGIMKGTFWSPNGNCLAFYRMDQTMVTDYPLVDISQRPATENLIKYPMAGMKSHEVTVGVYDVKSGKTIFLKTGEPKEQYLTNITWSPDDKFIYIQVVNRDQNLMKLNKYDATNGDFMKTVFEEKDEKYVEPLHPLIFLKHDPNQFLYISQKDGNRHIYLGNVNEKAVHLLTKGRFPIIDFIGIDEAEKNIYATTFSAKTKPTDVNLFTFNMEEKKAVRVSMGEGMHNIIAAPGCRYFIDRYSSIKNPRTIDLIDNTGKVLQTLLKADNPLKDYKLGETKIFTLKADDETDLYCRMITPPNYDPKKRYPSITYVYGGPHAQMLNNSWLAGGNLWMQMMAQQGYVVFTMDNRGSQNRGRDFEQVTFRQLGTVEMKDQLVGAKFLKSQAFIDSTRMGIHGWSFGGFMTTTMMLKNPGLYKAGVAGGPVIDWKYYEIMYTERYMDKPDENKEGYDKANLLNYVKNLKGKLMLIHGTVDDVVVWQHSQLFLKKAVDEGKQVDYFVYPGHPHNVVGKDRVNLMQKVTDYFNTNL
ncbi:MAG: DPP IV N-terminal domain-containing protein [Bacteroidetes bacterium]|nr:DPP IV N-terminal domain-containing protein [Bacteroidota bacterium]